MGDFNIDTLAPAFSNQFNQFLDEIKSLHLMPLINIPTRITESSATCIDHVYINQLTPCKYGVLNMPIADHLPIFCSIPCQSSLNGKKIHIKFRNTSDDCLSKFKSDVEKGLRHFHVYDNLPIDDKFQILNYILENSFNKHCPIKSKCVALKSYCSPWINNTLRDSIKEKHRLYNLCQEDPDFVPLYKQQRNLVSNKIKQAKMQYYNDKFNNNIHDAKSTWKVINNILKPNSKRQKDFQIEEKGTKLSDSTEIAYAFNNYFSSVAPNLAAEIPDVGIDPLSYLSRNPHSFVYFKVDYTEVKKQILSFKSKPSNIKSIPSFDYKFIVDVISPVLAKLINQSFEEGIFPSCLKTARVIPIHKAGSKLKVNNYRPISTLQFLSKVIEKLIHARITNFFDRFNLFFKNQFGFLKKRSTNDAILEFTEFCYSALNEKKFTATALLDFSKAFDTIDHNILVKKLECYGIRGKSNEWFCLYLANRKQYVEINDKKSITSTITCGVPQGSILGPLLFIIYINDMHKASSLQCIHYADDTTLFSKGNNLDDLIDLTNNELAKIDKWVCANKLSLNINKTGLSICSTKAVTDVRRVKMRNVEINLVNNFKFLGIIIDSNLSFSSHYQNICNKTSRSSSVLSKLGSYVPQPFLRKLYQTMIYPHLNYGIEIWGNSCKTGIKRLQRIQNKCIKIISSTNTCEPSDYASLKLMSFKHIHEYFSLIRFFKYYKLNESLNFKTKIENHQTNHSYNTRHSMARNLNCPNLRLSKLKTSFLYNSIKFWNKIPSDIKSAQNLNLFKKYLKESHIYEPN